MTIQLAYQFLAGELYEVYDKQEAENITDLVIEHVTNHRKIDRILNKNLQLTPKQVDDINKMLARLTQHEPVQYVLGETWFCNMKLFIDCNVLIPRPETEELVGWINVDVGSKLGADRPHIVDVGTGSGCIAIALKKMSPNTEVYAIDISPGALSIAKQNAHNQSAEILFYEMDILKNSYWTHLPIFDIIVSNPPYVKRSEEKTMANNVLTYEPHIALFVPDEDALKFYRAIAEFSKTKLAEGGSIYVEINEALSKPIVELFEEAGFKKIVLKKDFQGKDRMIKASSS